MTMILYCLVLKLFILPLIPAMILYFNIGFTLQLFSHVTVLIVENILWFQLLLLYSYYQVYIINFISLLKLKTSFYFFIWGLYIYLNINMWKAFSNVCWINIISISPLCLIPRPVMLLFLYLNNLKFIVTFWLLFLQPLLQIFITSYRYYWKMSSSIYAYCLSQFQKILFLL